MSTLKERIERKEAFADRERLDWLETSKNHFGFEAVLNRMINDGDTLREAIDLFMNH
jgi:hypothetical protein